MRWNILFWKEKKKLQLFLSQRKVKNSESHQEMRNQSCFRKKKNCKETQDKPCKNGTETSPPPTLKTLSFKSIIHCRQWVGLETITNLRQMPLLEQFERKRYQKLDLIEDVTWCLRSISSPKRNSIFGESSTIKEQG